MDACVDDIIFGRVDKTILSDDDTLIISNIKKMFLHVSQKDILGYNDLQDVCMYIRENCDVDEYRKYITLAEYLSNKHTKEYIPANPESATWKDYVDMLDFENINNKKLDKSSRCWIPDTPVLSKTTVVTYMYDLEKILFKRKELAETSCRNFKGNNKEFYEKYSRDLLTLDHSMFIMVSEELFDYVYETRERLGFLNKTVIFNIDIHDSPYYAYKALIDKCFDSQRSGYMYKTTDYFSYRGLFPIWWTKFKVIENAVDNDYFHSDNFTWVDFGLFKQNSYNTHELFNLSINSNPANKIRLLYFDEWTKDILNDREKFYTTYMFTFCAGYMAFPKKCYAEFMTHWNFELHKSLEIGLPSSEEIMLTTVYWHNPDLYSLRLSEYTTLLYCNNYCCHDAIFITQKFLSNNRNRCNWNKTIGFGKQFIRDLDLGKIRYSPDELIAIYDELMIANWYGGFHDESRKITTRMKDILSTFTINSDRAKHYSSNIRSIGVDDTMSVSFINDGCQMVKLPLDSTLSKIYEGRVHKESLLRQVHTYLIKNNIIDKTKNVIDLGAWIGDNVIPWAKMFSGTIYAIDPSEVNCEYIKRLAAINNCGNVQIIQSAISNVEKILYTSDSAEHCKFTTTDVDTKFSIKCTTLDILKSNNTITNIGFMHLDVEDMEYDVLCGAKTIIEEYRPIITYEVHTCRYNVFPQIKSMLHNYDYTQYMINEINYGCYPDCTNILSIPNEKVPNNFLQVYSKNLNILPDICYCSVTYLGSEGGLLYFPEVALTLAKGEAYYKQNRYNTRAKILVQITKGGKYNEVKILQQTGDPEHIVDCFKFIVKRYSVNNKNLIQIYN